MTAAAVQVIEVTLSGGTWFGLFALGMWIGACVSVTVNVKQERGRR